MPTGSTGSRCWAGRAGWGGVRADGEARTTGHDLAGAAAALVGHGWRHVTQLALPAGVAGGAERGAPAPWTRRGLTWPRRPRREVIQPRVCPVRQRFALDS